MSVGRQGMSIAPFQSKDRVVTNTQATFEVVGQGSGNDLIRLRARDGYEFEHPLRRVRRAPLIPQPNGSLGYEYQPGQKVMCLTGTPPDITRGTFIRYLQNTPSGVADVVVINDNGVDRTTTTNLIHPDPQGISLFHRDEDDDKDKDRANLDVRRQLRDLIESKIDFHKLDWNGHLKRGALWMSPGWFTPVEKRTQELVPDYWGYDVSQQEAGDLLRALETGTPMPYWVSLGRPMASHYLRCPYCETSEYDREIETNGVNVRLSDVCSNPDGHVDNQFTLDVPSGKLLVGNDLRDLAPVNGGRDDINGCIGRMRVTASYAVAGMAHGFVGNTCPGVYKLVDGSFTIGTYDNDDYEENPPEGSERVAGVCTDLWWYSILDYDLAKARCDALKLPWARILKSADVVDVEPGTYTFVHHNDLNRDAHTVVFAEFRRTGDAVLVDGDPYLDHFMNQRYTAGQVLAQSIRDWPTLYLKGTPDSVASIAAAADHIMCCNGNGVDFHQNGHPIGAVDADIVPIPAIPIFQGRYHWYPQSPGYSTLFRAAGMLASKRYRDSNTGETLNESFQELAYRILQNIICYGQDPYYSPPHESSGLTYEQAKDLERQHCREIMVNCVKAFYRLCKRYPETFPQVDPDFTAWMQNKRAVRTWVKSLPLDPPAGDPAYTAFLDEERAEHKKAMQAFLKHASA